MRDELDEPFLPPETQAEDGKVKDVGAYGKLLVDIQPLIDGSIDVCLQIAFLQSALAQFQQICCNSYSSNSLTREVPL